MPVLIAAVLMLVATVADAQVTAAELARADHVLNRLAFGPRPGEAARVAAMGVDRWIAAQLRPTATLDSAGHAALHDCPIWTAPAATIVTIMRVTVRPMATGVTMMTTGAGPLGTAGAARPATQGMLSTDSAAYRQFLKEFRDTTNLFGRANLPLLPALTSDSLARLGAIGRSYGDTHQFYGCRFARAEASDQQLVEVMTDFWANHFSVHHTRTIGRQLYVGFDRDAIRANALGRFRDLLGAVAHHPIMLDYLDNSVSVASRLNENYGRELLELHTLGVDGGYTQADVIDVARAFTGWTHTGPLVRTLEVWRRPNQATTVEFDFIWENHDTRPKTVLGRMLPAGRGIEDGEQVLDILARHPSTARFIAKKLAVRLVSDAPPAALVERAAASFLRTDGDIAEVVRTIVTSAEFFAPEARRAKLKSPIELMLSIRRALGALEDKAAESIPLLVELKQAPIGHPTPEGWPETANGWLGAGAVMTRVMVASRVAAGEVPSIPVDRWPEWNRLIALPFDAQVDGVVQSLLGGQVSETTRAAMERARPGVPTPTATERVSVLRNLVGLALASPDFQRR